MIIKLYPCRDTDNSLIFKGIHCLDECLSYDPVADASKFPTTIYRPFQGPDLQAEGNADYGTDKAYAADHSIDGPVSRAFPNHKAGGPELIMQAYTECYSCIPCYKTASEPRTDLPDAIQQPAATISVTATGFSGCCAGLNVGVSCLINQGVDDETCEVDCDMTGFNKIAQWAGQEVGTIGGPGCENGSSGYVYAMVEMYCKKVYEDDPPVDGVCRYEFKMVVTFVGILGETIGTAADCCEGNFMGKGSPCRLYQGCFDVAQKYMCNPGDDSEDPPQYGLNCCTNEVCSTTVVIT